MRNRGTVCLVAANGQRAPACSESTRDRRPPRSWPGVGRIWAFADVRNVASARVMEKLGMQLEGVLRQHDVRRGEFVDRAVYGLLRAEWEAAR